MRWALCAVVACTYQAGSFDLGPHHAGEQHATVGCLDVAVSREGMRLRYQVGNRCNEPALVDLAHVPVFGDQKQLRPYDPRLELREAHLDAQMSAEEMIEYRDDATPSKLCVDVAAIAHASPSQWQCWAVKS
jgi:hypothetical protein